jgi:uncharacterized protein YggT (Ycf19 family)
MSLDDKFAPVRTTIYEVVNTLFKKTAGVFGYPENPGMPTIYEIPNELYARSQFIDNLPKHKTYWPPIQRPETWFEMIFGPSPKVDIVPRFIYETKEEGFYNFYIENYKNIYFLPDWVSEFIQIRLNICLDISLLETVREVLFIGLMVYSQMVILRIAVSWFIYINPFTVPWCYLAAAVDWTEDVLQGVVPAILGVNITGSVFLGIIGAVADSLNHLVFTMPFLPSEAEETKLLINQEMRDVLVFHYLPVNWYRYPNPNDLREFWYNERPDILDYLQKAYKELDIQFLPDNIIQELNNKSDLVSKTNNIGDYLSTEVLSNEYISFSYTLISHVSENLHISFTQSLNHLF